MQKLSYQVQVSFRMNKYFGSILYDIQQYYDADGVVLKYSGTKIYLLLPDIYPHEPL